MASLLIDPKSKQKMKIRLLKYTILIALFIIFLVMLAVHGPIQEYAHYQDFADQRTFFHIPNFFNVASNVFFTLVGIIGLLYTLRPYEHLRPHFSDKSERIFYILFFIGLFFTGFTSGYYHWDPSYSRLLGDRLSLTIAMMSFFSAMVGERINRQLGLILLIPLIILGLFTVLYWGYTTAAGHEDLRPYVLVVQFPVAVFVPLLLLMFKPPYTGQIYLWIGYFLNLAAKVFEFADHGTYQWLHYTLSGHTLKHLLIALGSYFIFVYIRTRKPI